jgi:hypothetical protein
VGLIGEVLGSLSTDSGLQGEDLRGQVRAFAATIQDSQTYRQAVDLARMVQEIAWQGGEELDLCRTILSGFAQYLRSRPSTSLTYDVGMF